MESAGYNVFTPRDAKRAQFLDEIRSSSPGEGHDKNPVCVGPFLE
jgi:hypothetical protein